MRIEIGHDRLPGPRRDPVAARAGVFALIDEDRLGEAEQRRLASAEQTKKIQAEPRWTPAAIFRRIAQFRLNRANRGKGDV